MEDFEENMFEVSSDSLRPQIVDMVTQARRELNPPFPEECLREEEIEKELNGYDVMVLVDVTKELVLAVLEYKVSNLMKGAHWKIVPNYVAYLINIYVKPEFRGNGLAKELLRCLSLKLQADLPAIGNSVDRLRCLISKAEMVHGAISKIEGLGVGVKEVRGFREMKIGRRDSGAPFTVDIGEFDLNVKDMHASLGSTKKELPEDWVVFDSYHDDIK